MEHNENTVPLREYFELQIESVNKDILNLKQTIAYEKELVSKGDNAVALALTNQFIEYERRLTGLNHEAQRLSLMIPRLEFDLVLEQIKKDIKEIKDSVSVVQLWISRQEGKQARSHTIAIVAAIFAGMSVIVAAVALIKSF